MSGDLVIRPARQLDAGAIGAILSGFIDRSDWMPRIHSRAEEIAFAGLLVSRGWTTVAELDGKVAGFLSRNREEVIALYLDPAAQRRGIGTALVDRAKTEAQRLTLYCFTANDSAQAFYDAQGFSEAGRSDGTRNDEGLPDIFYVWSREGDGG